MIFLIDLEISFDKTPNPFMIKNKTNKEHIVNKMEFSQPDKDRL